MKGCKILVVGSQESVEWSVVFGQWQSVAVSYSVSRRESHFSDSIAYKFLTLN
jgi:hypothetical protein